MPTYMSTKYWNSDNTTIHHKLIPKGIIEQSAQQQQLLLVSKVPSASSTFLVTALKQLEMQTNSKNKIICIAP